MLFTFPSRYLFTIGLRAYSALADGPAGFTQGSTCPALLRIPVGFGRLRARGCHPLRRAFPGRFRSPILLPSPGPTTPGGPRPPRFGLVPVRSPLLGESRLFSFPAGTKMFQFPAFAPAVITAGDRPPDGRVAPFGHPGVKGRLRLTPDFRSLPRPSSPRGAKASTYAPLSACAAYPENRVPHAWGQCILCRSRSFTMVCHAVRA